MNRRTRSMLTRFAPIALALACGLATPAQASPVNDTFTYQGEIENAGTPASGSYDLRFRLYDDPAAGLQVGAQVLRTVNVVNGRFTTSLSFPGAFTGTALWVEVDARPSGGGAYSTLAPRQALTASPFAAWAINAGTANNATTAATAATATNATNLGGQAASFYTNAANLSTGTLPSARLSGPYTGALTLSNAANVFTGNGAGLTGLSAANVSAGTLADARLSTNVALRNATNTFTAVNTFNTNVNILGQVAVGAGAGLWPVDVQNTTNARSLSVASNLANGLISYGIYSQMNNASSTGYAFFANVDGTLTRVGYYADINGTTGTGYGVYTTNASPTGRGYYASMSGTGTSYGVYVSNSSPTGYGGYFNNTATTGTTYGLYCENNSTDGYGLFALHDASTGAGPAIYGRTDSTSASAYAIHGIVNSASSSSSSAAVRAQNLGGGYGVHATATGQGSGVYSTVTDGEAIYGVAAPTTTTETCYGGYFNGGTSDNSRGVYGSVSGAGIGIYGYSSGGYGGYFDTGVSGGAALYVVGTASVGVITIRGGADLAEHFDVKDQPQALPGMVVMIDAEHTGGMELARGAYNKRVAGVISGANNLEAGMVLGQFDGQQGTRPVALTGRVWTYVDATEQGVEPGDLLTTSDTPGYAMPAADQDRARGASIGKAMSRLPKGEKGLVLVLVNLQ